jgi:hypothetical protein
LCRRRVRWSNFYSDQLPKQRKDTFRVVGRIRNTVLYSAIVGLNKAVYEIVRNCNQILVIRINSLYQIRNSSTRVDDATEEHVNSKRRAEKQLFAYTRGIVCKTIAGLGCQLRVALPSNRVASGTGYEPRLAFKGSRKSPVDAKLVRRNLVSRWDRSCINLGG